MKISVKETVDPIPSIYQKNMVEISTQANRDIVAAHLPTFPSIKSVLYIGVGAAAAEAAMAAPLFARNNVSSMASEVAEPPHFLLPY